MAEKTPSHAQVWDDTELQDSWNEALAEYKKYHSLAAKGEMVKIDVPDANDDALLETKHAAVEALTPAATSVTTAQVTAGAQTTGVPAAAPMPPQALLGNVQDEDMKNLIMSWYYAGYYTGLYEGKQQGHASAMQRTGG